MNGDGLASFVWLLEVEIFGVVGILEGLLDLGPTEGHQGVTVVGKSADLQGFVEERETEQNKDM